MTHYFSEKQPGELVLFPIKIRLKQKEFEMVSSRGVFSKKDLDNGTKLLIENCDIKSGDNILDIGCGYGVVGIALSKIYNDINVLMTDINERAVKLSRINIKKQKLVNVKVKKSDLYSSITEKFDVILTNPPQTAGKKVCNQIISDSINYLNQGGTLQLVARHQKGGKELEKKMLEVFGNVIQGSKGSGFRIYISVKK